MCSHSYGSLNYSMKLAEKVAKLANTTHKDRVNEFNSKLEALSEHHDIPKVCPCTLLLRALLHACYNRSDRVNVHHITANCSLYYVLSNAILCMLIHVQNVLRMTGYLVSCRNI